MSSKKEKENRKNYVEKIQEQDNERNDNDRETTISTNLAIPATSRTTRRTNAFIVAHREVTTLQVNNSSLKILRFEDKELVNANMTQQSRNIEQ
jgi:hypothetical protein